MKAFYNSCFALIVLATTASLWFFIFSPTVSKDTFNASLAVTILATISLLFAGAMVLLESEVDGVQLTEHFFSFALMLIHYALTFAIYGTILYITGRYSPVYCIGMIAFFIGNIVTGICTLQSNNNTYWTLLRVGTYITQYHYQWQERDEAIKNFKRLSNNFLTNAKSEQYAYSNKNATNSQ